ncbi:hypothetical protein, partial [Burkholderia sp. Ac-20349]|uniref:hypothetical protein n=1 Tax=Burkholderia sp. Ac-20349 TaxID=2703893 RepID=UPI00197C0ED2
AELLKQLGGNRRQVYRFGFRFARHIVSFGASYALNTKLLTGPAPPNRRGPQRLRRVERGAVADDRAGRLPASVP